MPGKLFWTFSAPLCRSSSNVLLSSSWICGMSFNRAAALESVCVINVSEFLSGCVIRLLTVYGLQDDLEVFLSGDSCLCTCFCDSQKTLRTRRLAEPARLRNHL